MNFSLANLGLATLIFVLSAAISFGLAAAALVRMPATYFLGDRPPPLFLLDRPGWQRVMAHVGKNILGVLIVILGVILSVPGVPGQGILTILVGLTLIDFPGKRRLEQRIMRIPAVLHGANRIRARFGKGPFLMAAPVSS